MAALSAHLDPVSLRAAQIAQILHCALVSVSISTSMPSGYLSCTSCYASSTFVIISCTSVTACISCVSGLSVLEGWLCTGICIPSGQLSCTFVPVSLFVSASLSPVCCDTYVSPCCRRRCAMSGTIRFLLEHS